MARGMDAAPIAAVTVRLALATVLFGLFAALRRSLHRASTWRGAIAGTVFAIASLASQASFQKTSVSHASIIAAMQPLLLVVVPLSGQPRRSYIRDLGVVVVASAAAVVFILGGDRVSSRPATIAGDVWALVFLATWTMYFFLTRRLRPATFDLPSWMMGVFGGASVVLAPFWIAAGESGISVRDWVLIVGVVVCSTVLGQSLITNLLGRLPARTVSTASLVQPVIASLAAIPIFSEYLTALQIGAGVVILATVAYTVRRQVPA